MAAFTMPSLGADMDRGRLIEWIVKPGDEVHKGDIVAVVDTAKSEIEVEVFEDGIIGELLVEPGSEVPVGTPLATIVPLAPGEPAAPARETPAPAGGHVVSAREHAVPPREHAVPARRPGRPAKASRRHVAPAPTPPAHGPAPGPGHREMEPEPLSAAAPETSTREPAPSEVPVRRQPAPRHTAAPLVRKLAEEHGLELARILATGPEGRVTRADVERAIAQVTVRAKVSPQARRLASELGVDLTLLTPGDDGVIRAEHVRRAAASMAPSAAGAAVPATGPTRRTATGPATAPPTEAPREHPVEGGEVSPMRTAIARLMARSKREVPHYYLSTTVDLGASMAWMRERNRELAVSDRLVPAALILKATALSLREHPQLNGFWIDDRFTPGPGVHLGVAVSLRGGGLVAPAIHDAADLDLDDLMAALRDLVGRARAGRLRRAELADPTITVTNLGDQGVEAVFGVIHPPQVALVGVGRVVERPWAVEGLLGVRPVTTLTLSADHRATDGFTGSRYLDTIDRLLQEPESL